MLNKLSEMKMKNLILVDLKDLSMDEMFIVNGGSVSEVTGLILEGFGWFLAYSGKHSTPCLGFH